MKWFKHDTDANMDAKLQEVLLDYGLEGYGLYWYCIELIAGKISVNNITFSLEHDARIIARNTGSSPQKVQEMMTRFIELGLFELNDGLITCLKLARRLDQSMTGNPSMRTIITNVKNHDGVMTESCKIRLDKIRLDKIRLEESKEDKKESKQRFTPPTLEMIKQHFLIKGSTIEEAIDFELFYECKNWMVGKNKMSIWKSSATRWINNSKKDSFTKQQNAPRGVALPQ